LITPKGHQRIIAAQLWQSAVAPGFPQLNPRARLVQGDADLTMMGYGGILDDGYAHFSPFRSACSKFALPL
jgi:hypothetical protein